MAETDDDDTAPLPRLAREPADELTPDQREISARAKAHADQLPPAPLLRVRAYTIVEELVDLDELDPLEGADAEELIMAAGLVDLGIAVDEYLARDADEAFERLRRKLGLGGDDGEHN